MGERKKCHDSKMNKHVEDMLKFGGLLDYNTKQKVAKIE